MGASSGAGKGEGASIVYNKEMGGPMKLAPSRRRNLLDKSLAGKIIGNISEKHNILMKLVGDKTMRITIWV